MSVDGLAFAILPRRPRWLNRAWASLNGYFWLPCPACGELFGGHEHSWATVTIGGRERCTCWRHPEPDVVTVDGVRIAFTPEDSA